MTVDLRDLLARALEFSSNHFFSSSISKTAAKYGSLSLLSPTQCGLSPAEVKLRKRHHALWLHEAHSSDLGHRSAENFVQHFYILFNLIIINLIYTFILQK